MASVTYQNHTCKHVSVNVDGKQISFSHNFPGAEAQARAYAHLYKHVYENLEEGDLKPCKYCILALRS